MPSVFSKIIAGEFPGRFVWKDDRAVAFLTIEPLKPGHTLVVPRTEVDHWQQIEPGLMQHLCFVAQAVGKGIEGAFQPERVGLMILGLDVHHLHIHVSPIWRSGDLNFANADRNPSAESLDSAAEKLRSALQSLGYAEASA